MVLEAEIPAAGPDVSVFVDRLAGFLDQGSVDARAAHYIGVVLDEILANLAMHGDGPDQTVFVRVTIEPARLVGEVVDTGPAFNPRSIPDPDVTAPLAERPVGGLGLLLVRNLTDTLDYVSRDGKNWTTFSISRIPASAPEQTK
jgi:serine/threonine-protein kinase RsbW